MTTTRQSIVTWHPWPENGVEGLPENKPLLCLEREGKIWEGMVIWDGVNFEFFADGAVVQRIGYADSDPPTHYALASDLETVLIDDQQPVAPHSPKQISGTYPDKDRVRWLTDVISRIIKSEVDFQVGQEKAIAQVERERKEAGNE